MRNSILTSNLTADLSSSIAPEVYSSSMFHQKIILPNQSFPLASDEELAKSKVETPGFGTSRLNKLEQDTGGNLFEPECVIKTVFKQIRSPNVGKKTTFIKDEEKKLYKAHSDTSCFVCDINFLDNDLLLDHLKERKVFCRICTSEFNSHFSLQNHFTSHKGQKCVTCNEIFFCKKDVLQHFKKSEMCNKETEKFQCELCDRTFGRLGLLKKHKVSVHSSSEGKFECIVCKKEYDRQFSLEKHLNAVHVVFEYISCKICGKLYLGQKPLTTHMQQVHFENMKNITCVCSICGKIFARESIYRRHLAIHDETEALCEHCGQTVLGGRKGMQLHLNNKHSGKVFSCEVCSEQFDSRQKLRSHSRRHKDSSEEPQYCEICGKKYKNAAILKLHLAIHSDKRNFKCDVCGATFKQKVTLRTHSRIHSDTLKYSCDLCGQTFRWKQTYQKHIDKCRISFGS